MLNFEKKTIYMPIKNSRCSNIVFIFWWDGYIRWLGFILVAMVGCDSRASPPTHTHSIPLIGRKITGEEARYNTYFTVDVSEDNVDCVLLATRNAWHRGVRGIKCKGLISAGIQILLN